MIEHFDYDEADNLLAGHVHQTGDGAFGEQLQSWFRLAEELLMARIRNGAVEFFDDDSGLYIHPKDTVKNFDNKMSSEFMVREFMLLVNGAVGTYAHDNSLPMLYFKRTVKSNVRPPSTEAITETDPESIRDELSRRLRKYTRASHSRLPLPMGDLGIPHYAKISAPLRDLSCLVNQEALMRHLTEPQRGGVYGPEAMAQLATYVNRRVRQIYEVYY